jgi:hypothetical protein
MPNPNPYQARTARKAKAKPPSVKEASLIVWKALEAAQAILEESDPTVKLKACHAVFQGAQAFAKLHEVGELEARLEALENAAPGAANVSRLRAA